ncbi:hypothetical protein [Paenibacillus oleatilyticus]|uniref:hypothetical protein n=1 Tax=Paenibacillus oleatilyticus TaxID=2594886 RepID=UPI001C1F724C|nr:hypothetical protein [Paenibacillus oleatilyticus]MBU7316022.1 hypothetical protein [Paenibacillus oleatilyticus]
MILDYTLRLTQRKKRSSIIVTAVIKCNEMDHLSESKKRRQNKLKKYDNTYVYHNDKLLFIFPRPLNFQVGEEIEYLDRSFNVIHITRNENLIIKIEDSEEIFKNTYMINEMTIAQLEYHLNCLGYRLVKNH